MGWTTIAYSCGHTDQQQMYGKMTERERRAAYLGRGLCPTCLEAKHAADAAAAHVTATAQALPELQGSPKQIAWAETIRAQILATVDKIAAAYQPTEANAARWSAALAAIRSESSARYWIDNRGASAETLLNEIGRKLATITA